MKNKFSLFLIGALAGWMVLQAAGVFSIETRVSSLGEFPFSEISNQAPALAPPRPERPWIALTFDDGPHPEFTSRILKILEIEKVPATFFVVGKQAALHPQLLREIALKGHEIGNHTFHHPDLRKLSSEEVQEEFTSTEILIKTWSGKSSRFARPPGGRYNAAVQQVAARLGYTLALWSILPKDHLRPPPELIFSRVSREAHDGAVVLLHSGVESTLEALPYIISDLKERGYDFATLQQLAESSKKTSAFLPPPVLRVAQQSE